MPRMDFERRLMNTPGAPPPQADAQRDEEAAFPPRQRPRNSISSFLFLSFILFMMTNNSGDELVARDQYQNALASLEGQLGNYTTWLNGTDPAALNFSMPAKLPAEDRLIDSFVTPGKALDSDTASYFPNITGFIRGSSVMHNITPPALQVTPPLSWESYARDLMVGANMTEISERLGAWNWSAFEKVTMSVAEKLPEFEGTTKDGMANDQDSSEVAMIHGRIELVDSNSAEELRFDFEGVHFLKNGSIYGLADPSGHSIDIRLLPSLVPDSVRNRTAHLIEPELENRISKLKKLIEAGSVDADTTSNDSPKSACPFSVYAQLTSTHVSEEQMRELEDELQHPTGASTVRRPKLILNGILLSRDCGMMFEVNDAEGLRSRTFFRKITTYAGFSALVYLGLLLLLSNQTARSRTPAALARISRWTFFGQALADSISFAGHITFAVLAEGRPSLSLVAPAFLSCTLFAHEVRFALLISQVQAPEDTVPTPPPLATAPAPAPPIPASESVAIDTAEGTTEAAPVPANRGPDSANADDCRTSRADPTFLSSLIVESLALTLSNSVDTGILMFFLLTFVVRIVLAPSLTLLFFAVLYASFWVPQIVRAVQRGRPCALDQKYLVGTTVGRLLIAMWWMYLLAIFMFAQIFVLVLQDAFGPTFFLPQRYSHAQVYDYHPPLPAPDSEAPESSLGDCAICMDAIRLERRSVDGGREKERSGAGFFGVGAAAAAAGAGGRKSYSLAPCHHLFVRLYLVSPSRRRKYRTDVILHPLCGGQHALAY
ncbi:hypothetical protein EW146_g6501 [Bondarzewia mesenterica]|uniref:RING-type E3 ubiquitin transferase n=1 Tax=Bondarzewia mesenterica TaxID=1095465 RepID=A0A4S4LP98_9AGAM|nr:hypothetical protein EW146_g6501 [Bondarzewia mesenterica]